MSYFGLIKGRISDTVARILRLDASTHAMEMIDYAHHEVHSGSHYTFSATDGNLDTGGVLEFILTTANTTKWPHLVASGYGALHTRIELYENTTHTTSTVQTSYNNNRNSGNTAGMAINLSNDDNADGTRIFETEFGIDTGGGSNRRFGGGESRGDSERILKQNTKYLIRIESLTDDNVCSLVLEWYEHTDKD